MVIRANEEDEMSLINDYTYKAMTDQQERDLAHRAEQNWNVRLAMSGRVSWWRRLLARRNERIHTVDENAEHRGMATPQHRVAH
jgi:hypothetical protein